MKNAYATRIDHSKSVHVEQLYSEVIAGIVMRIGIPVVDLHSESRSVSTLRPAYAKMQVSYIIRLYITTFDTERTDTGTDSERAI
jgi:hypothetical protein